MVERRVRLTADVNAWERVRQAIVRRKQELGLTNRDFGKLLSERVGTQYADQWVSNLLNPKNPLSLKLKHLDDVAIILKTTPAQLVKSDYEQADYLTPTEYRIIEAMRALPASIRDHFLTLAEYLIGIAPQEIDFLQEYRELTTAEQERVRHWIHVTRIVREPVPGLAILPDSPETTAPPSATVRRTRAVQQTRKRQA